MKTSGSDLTQGSVLKALVSFALPFFAASLLQALYGAADLFVVGRFCGSSAISAVNIGSQVMQLITSFVIGCSMGATVLVARHTGEKKPEKSAAAFGSAIILFAVFAAAVTPVMLWQSENIVSVMQTPSEAVNEARSYVFICSLGVPFIVIFNVASAVFRGLGDSKTPMYAVALACVINIGGDFFLTGFCNLGAAGVASATVCAQAISSLCAAVMLMRRKLPFKFGRKNLHPDKSESKGIAVIGLPIAMQDTLINISFMILTVIANNRGLSASSAVGVVEKLIMFMFLVPSAMLSAISAITAQNFGAAKLERAVKSVKYGIIITAAFGAAVCLLSHLVPDALTGLFTNDAEVIKSAGEYLKSYSIDCILVAATFCLNGYLCGVGKSIVTFAHNVVSIFLVRIPAAYFLSVMFPESLYPMGLASPLGSAASILILAAYFAFTGIKSKRLSAEKSLPKAPDLRNH